LLNKFSFFGLYSQEGSCTKGAGLEVVAEETCFPGAPTCSDPRDGPSTYFPNPRVMRTLKKLALEEKYVLPVRYKFVISGLDATINKLPVYSDLSGGPLLQS